MANQATACDTQFGGRVQFTIGGQKYSARRRCQNRGCECRRLGRDEFGRCAVPQGQAETLEDGCHLSREERHRLAEQHDDVLDRRDRHDVARQHHEIIAACGGWQAGRGRLCAHGSHSLCLKVVQGVTFTNGVEVTNTPTQSAARSRRDPISGVAC